MPGAKLKDQAMKNLFRWMTMAAVLAGGFTFAADEKPAAEEGQAKKAERARKGPGEEGATLTPEERKKRRAEMAEKREAKLKELKAKKAAGTLTDKEQRMLDRLEKSGEPGPGRRRPGAPKKEDAEK